MSFSIQHGDVAEHLPALEAESFDACLCDPPYALTASKGGNGGGFMGQKWDLKIPGPEVWREVLRVESALGGCLHGVDTAPLSR